jgi:DNA-binding winged helix-turn-helix (wHTH) protein
VDLSNGFRLAGMAVRPDAGTIQGPGGPRQVEPKAMAVLIELARHPVQVRTRAQIEEVVWPRGWVSDDVLTRCIGQLRRALGDQARAPRFLQTLPRRGYRLSVAPESLAEAAGASSGAASGGWWPPALQVRALQALSSRQGPIAAAGLTAMLADRLWRAGQPIILAPPAAGPGAGTAVEGTVLHAGPCLQAMLRLVDTRDGSVRWSGTACAASRDLLPALNGIADELATQIVGQLAAGHPAAGDHDGAVPIAGRPACSRSTPPSGRGTADPGATACPRRLRRPG